jgi:Predicted signal transduction protein with a C-terminal ATPase domain
MIGSRPLARLFGRRPSLSRRIVVACCLIVAFSLLLCCFVAYEYTYSILRGKYIESATAQLEATARQFTYLANDIEKVAVSEALDGDIQRFLRNPAPEDPYLRYSQRADIQRRLSALAVQRDYILNMAAVREASSLTDDDIVMSGPQTDYGLDAHSFRLRLSELWYADMAVGQRDLYSSPIDVSLLHGQETILPYILKVSDMQRPERLIGRIVLNVRLGYMRNAFTASSQGAEYCYWLDGTGRVLSADPRRSSAGDLELAREAAASAEPGKLSSRPGSGTIALVDRSMRNGWAFVSVVELKTVSARLRSILYFFIAYTAAILAATFAIIFPLMLNIMRPLSKLAQAMREVSVGGPGASFELEERDDEVGQLARQFEGMMADIDRHVSKEAEFERAEKRMQLDLLLAQINPHFIYNTLQTIVYMAKRRGADDIAEVTTSFIGVLQDVARIGDGSLTTSLGDEIELVRRYLDIQRYRYADRFSVEWAVEPGLDALRVPRSILQPVVENALQHGILPKARPGILRISARRERGDLIVEVWDDGAGIPAASLVSLLEPGQEEARPGGMRSIGLRNVEERIKYICGIEYGLTVESVPGQFTLVAIRVPSES